MDSLLKRKGAKDSLILAYVQIVLMLHKIQTTLDEKRISKEPLSMA